MDIPVDDSFKFFTSTVISLNMAHLFAKVKKNDLKKEEENNMLKANN